MKPRTKRWGSGLLAALLVLGGCGTPEGQLALETFGRGLAGLILSPLMILAGLAQGLAFLPYTVGTGLTDLNRALLQAHAVSLDDSYRATFGVPISDPRVNPQSGEVAGEGLYGRHRPEAMFEATRAFQKLLVSQGMPEERAQHYVLTGIYTHTRTRGHILLAVVYRHPGMQPFRVVSRHTGIVTTFRPEHMGWREPYERDVNRPADRRGHRLGRHRVRAPQAGQGGRDADGPGDRGGQIGQTRPRLLAGRAALDRGRDHRDHPRDHGQGEAGAAHVLGLLGGAPSARASPGAPPRQPTPSSPSP
jgi:hypothetical protein